MQVVPLSLEDAYRDIWTAALANVLEVLQRDDTLFGIGNGDQQRFGVVFQIAAQIPGFRRILITQTLDWRNRHVAHGVHLAVDIRLSPAELRILLTDQRVARISALGELHAQLGDELVVPAVARLTDHRIDCDDARYVEATSAQNRYGAAPRMADENVDGVGYCIQNVVQ